MLTGRDGRQKTERMEGIKGEDDHNHSKFLAKLTVKSYVDHTLLVQHKCYFTGEFRSKGMIAFIHE